MNKLKINKLVEKRQKVILSMNPSDFCEKSYMDKIHRLENLNKQILKEVL